MKEPLNTHSNNSLSDNKIRASSLISTDIGSFNNISNNSQIEK